MTNWLPPRGAAILPLPLKIAEPNGLTTYTYDANGNLLTRTLRATTDATGALGFGATQTGTARKWTYTYSLRTVP